MKRIIVFLLAIYLILPIFVYQIKEVSRVHVMKFTGSFEVIYQDIKLFSDTTSFVQHYVLDIFYFPLLSFFFIILISNYKHNYYSVTAYLISHARAPPLNLLN